ncbi:response regulator [Paenibacillus sp. sgz302251]|uniref:response regulator n=1 Tax=Paenibacillus sp. sgz302251 TaxID=3414493 RepID=UPI003C7DA883
MIRVLIVDDDPFIRESMQVILDLDQALHVVGVCSNGKEAADFVSEQPVDVVLMDIRMPVCDGVEGTKRLRALEQPPAVLILTTFDDDEYVTQAIRNGANGYLLKNVPPSRIISGIKTVYEGSMLIHPAIARKLAGLLDAPRPSANTAATITGLTQAEIEIVRLIADGQSNKEIAASLFLSEGTIKNYISEILHKLELRDRTQIAIFYLKLLHQSSK